MVKNKKIFFLNMTNLMKPESKFLICDFFFGKTGLDEEDLGSNLRIVKKENITENVCESLLRSDRSLE